MNIPHHEGTQPSESSSNREQPSENSTSQITEIDNETQKVSSVQHPQHHQDHHGARNNSQVIQSNPHRWHHQVQSAQFSSSNKISTQSRGHGLSTSVQTPQVTFIQNIT